MADSASDHDQYLMDNIHHNLERYLLKAENTESQIRAIQSTLGLAERIQKLQVVLEAVTDDRSRVIVLREISHARNQIRALLKDA